MFWIVSRKRDIHVTERKLVSDGGGYNYWVESVAHSSSFNPKIGLGDVMIIEGETAREVKDYAIKQLRADFSSGKWRMPRDHGVPSKALTGAFYGDDKIFSTASGFEHADWFIHFHNGYFFHLNGLHQVVIRDLFSIYERKNNEGC